ncbi:LRR kinase family protein [Medicago truncatula]|uniref:LRR kinase family protein n=2 Tax=Medicago truncatula TaxID=3880 RepID=G7LHD1_MEDTR|nr:LRR kinase family protein [Medicago truncatula]
MILIYPHALLVHLVTLIQIDHWSKSTSTKSIRRKHSHTSKWAIPIIEGGNIQNIVDMRLQGEFSIDSAWKVVEIAMSCISQTATERPDISQIFAELKKCVPLEMVQTNNGSTRSRDDLVSVATVSETTILAR